MSDAPKKKKAVNGKSKGGEFERLVCKTLSLWVSNGQDSNLFWRSATSGGRATVQRKAGAKASEYQASDISPVAPGAYILSDVFAIECKAYKDIQLNQLVFEDKSLLLDFWNQANRDALAANKKPMLIAKQNMRKPLLGIQIKCYNYWKSLYLKDRNAFPKTILIPRYDLALLDLEKFLALVDPQTLLHMKDL